MKVVAYNIKESEKELLALANAKVHDLTLISNGLNFSTIHYAIGKDVVIVSERDILDNYLLDALLNIGIQRVITRSVDVAHIDMNYAQSHHIHVANTPEQSPRGIAEQTIRNLNIWSKGSCPGTACQCAKEQ